MLVFLHQMPLHHISTDQIVSVVLIPTWVIFYVCIIITQSSAWVAFIQKIFILTSVTGYQQGNYCYPILWVTKLRDKDNFLKPNILKMVATWLGTISFDCRAKIISLRTTSKLSFCHESGMRPSWNLFQAPNRKFLSMEFVEHFVSLIAHVTFYPHCSL